MITLNSAYTAAKASILKMNGILLKEKNPDILSLAAIEFEDSMNGLSGEILNLDPQLQTEIQEACSSIVALGSESGVEISLYESLLPTPEGVAAEVLTVVGKKLYPLTTTVEITNSNNTTTTITVDVPAEPETIESEDVVDSIFEENDAQTVAEPTLAELQNETTPYLKNGVVELSKVAASNANGLQAGLTTFSHNPLATLIEDTKALLLYYTSDNYANLNVALSGVSSDNNLSTQYKALREAIGGADGLAGCVAQIDFFREHTDRLSGLILDVNSPNDVVDNDSTDEYLNVNDVSGGPTVIFSFDARYFRSAKYMVQATAAALDRGHQTNELYILHDNHHAYTRELTSIYTQDPFVTFTTRLLNNRVEVLANTTASNTDFVIHGVKLRIARAAQSYGEMSQTKIIEQHTLLQSYLNDGVDYVALQSGSLLKGYLVANLSREFRDMLVNFSSSEFLAQSTGAKQTQITAMVETIKSRRTDLQTSIETDYNNFVAVRRLAESLDIAYNLSAAYTNTVANTIPTQTLNTAMIQAIEADE